VGFERKESRRRERQRRGSSGSMSKKWGGEGGCLRVEPLIISIPWRHGLGRHA
jgi:hypothetical protein